MFIINRRKNKTVFRMVEILSVLNTTKAGSCYEREDNERGLGKSSAKRKHLAAVILLHCVMHYRLASKNSMDLCTTSETCCFHCILLNAFLTIYQRYFSQALRQSDKNILLSSKPYSHKGGVSMQRFSVIAEHQAKLKQDV